MTYKELRDRVLGTATSPGQAFPLGVPENLVQQAQDFLLEALIEIQRCIECYQVGHVDVIPATHLMVQNGTNVLSQPPGQVTRLYTVLAADGGWNQPIPYNPVDLKDLRRWMGRFRQQWHWLGHTTPPGTVYQQEGFTQPNAGFDSPAGRALMGIFALDKGSKRLIVAPWLQSTESLVIEWTGIKRVWNDEDLVSDEPDFIRLVKHWILQEYGRTWAAADLQVRVDTWRGALADGIVSCNELRRLDVKPRNEDEADAVRLAYACTPPGGGAPGTGSQSDTARIAMVGDSGTNDDNARAVADAIVSQSPNLVVILGDAVYQPNSVEEGLSPYLPVKESGRLIVALGNHDLDLGLTAVPAFVPNPGNGRYFNVVSGPVEIFVVDSGLDTLGAMVEPDGNYAGSAQWTSIRAMIARSCARWKLVVLHHAPFTSGDRYAPGLVGVRWVSDLGVHAVISAHSHNYERGSWRNRPHFVVGTGGRTPQDGFVTPPVDGSLIQIESFGYVIVNANPDSMTIEFIGVPSGDVLDTVTITGEPPIMVPEEPTIDKSPPVIVSQPVSRLVHQGDVTVFSVVATGAQPLTYQWFKNGVAMVGELASTLTITNALPEDVGAYWVVVTNAYGSATSVHATLNVLTDVQVPIVFPDIAQARAATIDPHLWVDIRRDGNNTPGQFYRNDAFDTAFRIDGVDYFRDAVAHLFERIRPI